MDEEMAMLATIKEAMANIDHLKAYKKTIEASISNAEYELEQARDALFKYMELNGLLNTKTALGTAYISDREKVDYDEATIPRKFFFLPRVEEKLDKDAVKQALASGEKIPGVEVSRALSVGVRWR